MLADSPKAHGQAVGFWHPDADATPATTPTRRAGNGDHKPGTGETTEQPLKPSRREGRMSGS
ncbi:hypothetical protein, partial [Bradyrhizobium sp. ORS 285]|uniref:hypothetical protein n=1 Tax=Bradyrhizobium sp. ORS 285 TaxID=115808 RepID=UPI001AEC38A5